MSNDQCVLVTGANGGIGRVICSELMREGYYVIGTDLNEKNTECHKFVQTDLIDLTGSSVARDGFHHQIISGLANRPFKALINNAAVQLLGDIDVLDIDDFSKSMSINVTAPLVLAKLFRLELTKSSGSIINIGSIHATLTKPRFISYATSKAALLGLTRALAVDMGGRVRVNIVQPAATETEMLLTGFKDNPEGHKMLGKYHPANRIAEPKEIAKAVLFLISDSCPFMTGSSLDINGGIGYRLHDPE